MSHHKTEGQGWSSLIFQTFNIISKIGIRILASVDGTVVVIKNHKLDQLMLSNVNCFYSLSLSLASFFLQVHLFDISLIIFLASTYFFPIQLLHKLFPLVLCSFLPVSSTTLLCCSLDSEPSHCNALSVIFN